MHDDNNINWLLEIKYILVPFQPCYLEPQLLKMKKLKSFFTSDAHLTEQEKEIGHFRKTRLAFFTELPRLISVVRNGLILLRKLRPCWLPPKTNLPFLQ